MKGDPTPRDAAARVEDAPVLPAGAGERFTGYGVLGVAFASGHVLALRRMAASSVGPAFTSVWHREPGGAWTFFVDADPDVTCGRYFGSAGRVIRDDGIAVTWHGTTSFSVRVPRAGLAWAVHLATPPGIRALVALRRWLPQAIRRRPAARRTLAAAARRLLRTDHLTLAGEAPSGHGFRLDARDFWLVDASTARRHGEHLGPPVALRAPVRLGDFTIPAWGVFTIGEAFFSADMEADAHRI
jgi:hypothetical protein